MEETGHGEIRILGIDPGERRVGLALSDPLGLTAQGMDTYTVTSRENLIIYLQSLVERYKIIEIVVGLPMAMGGGEIEGTGRSRELARLIEERCGVPVVLVDERMTSREAERVLGAAGRKSDRGDIDRLAAVLLLQGYLDGRKRR